jgi:hypothetical protein
MLLTAAVVPIVQEKLECEQHRHTGFVFGRQVIHATDLQDIESSWPIIFSTSILFTTTTSFVGG